MLSLRLNKWAKLGLVLLSTSFISLWVSAQNDCGEEICLSLPTITAGNVIDEQYFHGNISIQSNYKDFLGVDKTASYSLDGGVSWNALNVKHSFKPALPIGAKYPSAALYPNGSFVVVWQEGASDQAQEIYAQRYTATGLPDGSKIQVNIPPLYYNFFATLPYDTIGYPRVTAQPNGEFVVSWQEKAGLFITTSLVSKRYNKQNESIGEPLWLARGLFGGGLSIGYHDTAQLANGSIIVVWETHDLPLPGDENYKNIRFVSISPEGQIIGGGIANTHVDGMQVNPRVAALEDGGFVIVWQSLDQDNAGWGVYSQRYDVNIQPVAGESRVNIDGDFNEAFPSVTGLAGGGYAIAWEQKVGAVLFTITRSFTQIYNANGNRLGLPFPVHDIAPSTDNPLSIFNNDQLRPILYGLSNGEIVVAWRQERQGLVFKRFNQDGSAIDDAPINPQLVPLIQFSSWWNVLLNLPVTSSGNIWPHADDGFIYADNLSNIVSVPGVKQLVANNLSPITDIDIQFKVEDTPTGQVWYSPIRSYFYADPDSGQLGFITYKDGYSNESSETVSIDMNCNSCQDLQLYERSAVLYNDACEVFGEWLPYGASSTLNTEVLVGIEDARCYQYKATVTNILGNNYDYTSTNILKVDQTAPVITVNSETLIWDQMALDIQVNELTTGILSSDYTLNDSVVSTFSTGTLNTIVQNGVNRFIFTAIDKAGNTTTYNHFVTADLTPPDIVIHSIEDGGVYGDDISLVYALTQELTDLVILVDGVPRSDLTGLADGIHTLTIQGLDASGNLISKTITFTIDKTKFSLSLLSPQSRLYENNSITIEYAASKAVKRVWYKLNGGADMTDLALTNLADGDYNLVLNAESDTGVTTSVNANFSVKLGVPTLQVLTPEANRTFSENQIKVTFSSDSQVRYELGSQTGTLSSGDTLVVPEDGNYTLLLSAIHPVSGNVITEIVPFSVDTQVLDLTLQSPQAVLYAHNDIPISYTANKPLNNLLLTLDGNEVTSLSGLLSGQHNFHLTAEDSSGRQIERQIQFTVTSLDIINPQDGTVVVSNTAPPVLPFEYNAGQELSSFAYSLDHGPKQLLTKPANTVIPLTMPPGQHELRLQGSLNEFKVGKRSQFEIGAKNISVGPGSIDYRYDNCDAEGVFCDLNVTLQVSNSGDLDVFEPIRIRFNHITDVGFQTQEHILNSLTTDTHTSIVMSPIRARIGDTLMVTVDPFAELNAEWLEDNLYQITFETGQITNVLTSLNLDNTYLERVSVFNTFAVSTAGPVASVEVQMNGWTFVDNIAADGFFPLADMGLLSNENNCIHVLARSSAQVVLDSTSLCVDVKKLALENVTPLEFPWGGFISATNYVVTSTLDTAAVAVALAEARYYTLQQPASLVAMLKEDSQLDYKLMADPAAVQNQSYSKAVNMGEAPIVGGYKQLPNGHGLFVSSLNPTNNTCSLDGGIPIMSQPRSGELSEIFNRELEEINDGLNLGAFNLSQQQQFGLLLLSTVGLPVYAQVDIYSIDLAVPVPKLLNFLDTIDFGITFLGWIRGDIPSQLAYVDVYGNYSYGFTSEGCLMVDDIGSVSLSMLGKYSASIDAGVNLTTAGAGLDVFGALMLDIEGIPIPATAIITVGGLNIHSQNINIPFTLDIGVDIAVVDQRLYFGPTYASFEISVNHSAGLADADIVGYPIFLAGFGYGEEITANITLHGKGRANAGGGNHRQFDYPDSYQLHYMDFYGNLTVYSRKKYCFLGACYHESWKVDSVPFNQSIQDGVAYTDDDVASAQEQLEGFDLGSLNDLTSIGLYAIITGDTQLAEEYLSCAVYQNITENLPNIPIYSDRTGQCTLVTDPDYKPAGVANYFSDTSCSVPISYTPTPFMEFCRNNLLDDSILYTGNSAAWPDSGDDSGRGIKSTQWTLAHGPSIDILAVSPQGNYRPFMKQAEYRVINDCHLEMRIFKKNAQANNLKPMMFIHGGAWKYRGIGSLGAMISHFTERDYVVFAPFYRLMGTSVGPAECHIPPGTDNVAPGEKIVDDIEAALDWVKTQGDVFGAAPGSQVALVGQSAGAHLSGWLSSHRSSDISQALLFYPPTDIEHVVQEGQPGGIYGSSFDGGKSLVAQFLNYEAFSEIDPNNTSPFVQENGFPNLIRQGIDHPPVFMIHGTADSLVPIALSTRQCDALAGLPYSSTSTNGGVYNCGNQRGKDSRLHIIDGAEHVLDLKCFVDPSIVQAVGNPEAGYKLCPAGSLANEALVKSSIEQALEWIQ